MKKLLLIAAFAAMFAISSASIKTQSLDAHNKYRAEVGVSNLIWSSSLAHQAENWADHIARKGKVTHSNIKNVGENIAYGSSRSSKITDFVDAWAEEKEDFVEGQNYPNCSATGDVDDVEHYTQMVWEGTQKLGCGSATRSGKIYYVCQYYPAGNANGQPVYTTNTTTDPSDPVDTDPTDPTGPTDPTDPTDPVDTDPTDPTDPVDTDPTDPVDTDPESSDPFIADALAAHNNERKAHGVAPLKWSTTLAQSAKAYSQSQAQTGNTGHSAGRNNVGENLAWGSGSKINTNSLIQLWVDEKKYFIVGKNFPDCSTTGSWHDVAHYTQMMWAKTTEVGCGMTQAGSGRYYLVCHYSPQGNINGNPVYTTTGSTGSGSTGSGSTGSGSTGSGSTGSGSTGSGSTGSGSTGSGSTGSGSTGSGSTGSGSTGSGSTGSGSTGSGSTGSGSTGSGSTGSTSDSFVNDALTAHNNERAAHGVPALKWSTTLAQSAKAYSQSQAQTGNTGHSSGRVNVGENLAWGSGSKINTNSLIQLWINEKTDFIAGKNFPDCSTTGSWHDVAHYTQLMWRKTTEVGCGMTQASSGRYYLVCHYSPQGNMNGNPVY